MTRKRMTDEQIQVQKAMLKEALGQAQGRAKVAAEILNIPIRTLYNLVKRHELDIDSFRPSAFKRN